MPQALDPHYAIRIMHKDGRFKLQYRVLNEAGEYQWVTAAIVNDRGDPIGYSIEAVIETVPERRG